MNRKPSPATVAEAPRAALDFVQAVAMKRCPRCTRPCPRSDFERDQDDALDFSEGHKRCRKCRQGARSYFRERARITGICEVFLCTAMTAAPLTLCASHAAMSTKHRVEKATYKRFC